MRNIHYVIRTGRFPVKAVADTLGMARSNLVERARDGLQPRQVYRKAGGADLLARIRPLVDRRPSHGYRRITALLDRESVEHGLVVSPGVV